jgi:hypothetical protein
MNIVLAPLLRKSVLVFFDDILVYNSTYEHHLHHSKEVLELLQQDSGGSRFLSVDLLKGR